MPIDDGDMHESPRLRSEIDLQVRLGNRDGVGHSLRVTLIRGAERPHLRSETSVDDAD